MCAVDIGLASRLRRRFGMSRESPPYGWRRAALDRTARIFAGSSSAGCGPMTTSTQRLEAIDVAGLATLLGRLQRAPTLVPQPLKLLDRP
jgi:hypothetical protein